MAVGKSGYLDVTVMPQSVGKVRLYWREDYDEINNYSTITVTDLQGYLWHRAAWAYVYASLTADDVTVLPNTNGGWMFSANTDTTLRSVVSASNWQQAFTPVTSAPIYHNADGTKTVTLTFTLHDVIAPDVEFNGANNQQVSQTVTLTEIPRASAVTVSGSTIGSPLLLTVESANSAFLHTLSYTFGAVTEQIAELSSEVSFRWTPPMELCRQIPAAESGICTVTCDTYSGGKCIGSKTAQVTLTVPYGVALTLSEGWATVAPRNTDTAAEGMNLYIQGYSAAQVTFDESKIGTDNAYGATPAAYSVRWSGGTDDGSHCTGVLTAAGSTEIRCVVTDTRGRTMSEVLTVNVLPYAKPTLSGIGVFRCTSDGIADDGGTALSVTAVSTVSSLDGHNSCLLQAQYCTKSGSYGSRRTIQSGTAAVLWAGELSPRESYEVHLTAVDTLGNTALCTVVIPTDDAFFHGRQGGKGAAFGKYAEQDDLLEVAWSIRGKQDLAIEGDGAVKGTLSVGGMVIEGRSLLDFFYPVGRVILTDGETDPADLYGGGWEIIEEIGGHRAWRRVTSYGYAGAVAGLAIVNQAICSE